VTRTAAIASGYGLEDGVNVRLVAPGDADGFGGAIADLLGNDARSGELGRRARATVEAGLSWDRYVDQLATILRAGPLSGMDDSSR
jgi:glycosyltransferase involved in cell wall biosynthesis